MVSLFYSLGLSTLQACSPSGPCSGSTSVFASPDLKLTLLQLDVGFPPYLVYFPPVLLCSFLLPSLVNPSPATGWTGNVDRACLSTDLQQIGVEQRPGEQVCQGGKEMTENRKST